MQRRARSCRPHAPLLPLPTLQLSQRPKPEPAFVRREGPAAWGILDTRQGPSLSTVLIRQPGSWSRLGGPFFKGPGRCAASISRICLAALFFSLQI